MTLRAVLVQPRHGKAARRLENVAAVRVVALNAIHLTFHDRVMLRQTKFGLSLQMALETGARILAGIHNEFATAAPGFDMLASRAMARFATRLAVVFRVLDMHARVGAGGKDSGDIRVALRARVIANVCCSGNVRRRNNRPSQSRTGNCEEHNEE